MSKRIKYGECHCGCGEKTNIITQNHTKDGKVKGQPYRFIKGHEKRRPLDQRFWAKVDKTNGSVSSCVRDSMLAVDW